MADHNGHFHRLTQLTHSTQNKAAMVGGVRHKPQLFVVLHLVTVDTCIELATIGISHDARTCVHVISGIEFVVPNNGKFAQVDLVACPYDLLDRGFTSLHLNGWDPACFAFPILFNHCRDSRINAESQPLIAGAQVDEDRQFGALDVGK